MRLSLMVTAAIALAACGAEAPQASRATTRDSAGITIVESVAPAESVSVAWGVDSIPILDVGGSETDTTKQFANIRGLTLPWPVTAQRMVNCDLAEARLTPITRKQNLNLGLRGQSRRILRS
jgi:hypothetical protein